MVVDTNLQLAKATVKVARNFEKTFAESVSAPYYARDTESIIASTGRQLSQLTPRFNVALRR